MKFGQDQAKYWRNQMETFFAVVGVLIAAVTLGYTVYRDLKSDYERGEAQASARPDDEASGSS